MHALLPEAQPLLLGGGRVEPLPGGGVRLSIPPRAAGYADAQLDDHRALPRRRFAHRPPLRLSLRARASHPQPAGTLGFGFWNDPFSLSLGQAGAARRLPAPPCALWFFYASPPSALALAAGAPPHGWKAASLRAPALPGALFAPAALAAWVLSRLPPARAPILRLALGRLRAAEAALAAPLDEWHEYTLEWHTCEARFHVDGRPALAAPAPPAGPLGFIAWIDNQFGAASPEAGLRFGLVATDQEQWLELRDLRLEVL